MAMFGSPGLQISEQDVSQYITNNPTGIAALVVNGVRGPIGPQYITSVGQFKNMYCASRSTVDVGNYNLWSGVYFLQSGYGGLWVNRAINAGTLGAGIVLNTASSTTPTQALTSGLVVGTATNSAGQTYLSGYTFPAWTTFTATGDTPLMLLYAKSPGALGNNISVTTAAVTGSTTSFVLTLVEKLPNGTLNTLLSQTVSIVPALDGNGNSIYISDVLANNNDVGVVLNPAATGLPAVITTPVNFSGGVDAPVTTADIVNGINPFYNTELYTIDMFIQGGIGSDTYRAALVTLAETIGSCIAILDTDSTVYTTTELNTWRSETFTNSTSYAAVFAPWLLVYDSDNDTNLYVPPSGFIAAMMVKVAYEYAPWWSIAGLQRGAVSVLGLQNYYTLGDRNLLDTLQVNAFVRRPGAIALWNNRTLQSFSSALSFIETRRLLNYIERNVKTTLESFLFEPLVDTVRQRIVYTLNAFMKTVQQGLGVYNYTIESDPLGTGNNPWSNVQQGVLTVYLSLQPVMAIRNIGLTIYVTAAGVSITENVNNSGT